MTNQPLRVFFGHHKCGTGWIDNILREACFHLGWHFKIVAQTRQFEPFGSLGGFVQSWRCNMLAYINADAEYIGTLPAHRGFHVVRDPRDIIVSGYFSHRNSHPTDQWPELIPHRARLLELPMEEGLLLEMEFSRQFLDPMIRWDYRQPHVLEMKLEDLSAKPLESFTRIFGHLGLLEGQTDSLADRFIMGMNVWNQRGRRFMPGRMPIFPMRFPREHLSHATLRHVLDRMSFERLSGGRKKGQENVKSHYRKGQAGDWRNHFNAAHVAAFKEKYNDLLIQTGYESDANWQ
jgi:hypothetical protein